MSRFETSDTHFHGTTRSSCGVTSSDSDSSVFGTETPKTKYFSWSPGKNFKAEYEATDEFSAEFDYNGSMHEDSYHKAVTEFFKYHKQRLPSRDNFNTSEASVQVVRRPCVRHSSWPDTPTTSQTSKKLNQVSPTQSQEDLSLPMHGPIIGKMLPGSLYQVFHASENSAFEQCKPIALLTETKKGSSYPPSRSVQSGCGSVAVQALSPVLHLARSNKTLITESNIRSRVNIAIQTDDTGQFGESGCRPCLGSVTEDDNETTWTLLTESKGL